MCSGVNAAAGAAGGAGAAGAADLQRISPLSAAGGAGAASAADLTVANDTTSQELLALRQRLQQQGIGSG